MNILLVYPRYPDTFWSFKHALRFTSKEAAFPPLGLLTVAAMLPDKWPKKLVDMNTSYLWDKEIRWADYVFISAMSVQQKSASNIIKRCNKLGTKIVCGGPLFTSEYYEFDGVDHFVLGEAEVTLQPFLEDIKNGCAKHIYISQEKPAITETPVPMWKLIDTKKYHTLSLQYSRGCPFDCEFCDITVLNGRVPRTKNVDQFVAELEALRKQGWRGDVLVVDDNFIGNQRKLKYEILPAMIEWMEANKYPFSFFTEASINLADDEDLIRLMLRANFIRVFIGIETPNEDSLIECNKFQNKKRDLISAVKKMQNFGMMVDGGFIVGFDKDPKSIFDRQIDFIQKSGIVTAMVGLLNAPVGTKLYKRLEKENRLVNRITGDNTDGSINFVPKMDVKDLVGGYNKIIHTIYKYRNYYERIKTLIRELKLKYHQRKSFSYTTQEYSIHLKAFIKSIWHIGLKEKGRMHYWKLLGWTLLKHPRSLAISITLAIYGVHFRRMVEYYTGIAF
ncbi:B12-binding domain-containing radical SAM protein [Chloroflexota bacterium]